MIGDAVGAFYDPTYVLFSVGLSLILVILFVAHAVVSARRYWEYHDDRAAVTLMLSITKVVVAFGLLIAALGAPLDNADYAKVGLSLARGSLLVAGVTLLLADKHVWRRSNKEETRQ